MRILYAVLALEHGGAERQLPGDEARARASRRPVGMMVWLYEQLYRSIVGDAGEPCLADAVSDGDVA